MSEPTPSNSRPRPAQNDTQNSEALEASLTEFNNWQRNSSDTQSSPENDDDTFTVAFWNIQRIPFAGLRNPDYSDDRLQRMMDILSKADVAAIAEQFMRAPNTDHAYRVSDNARGRMRILPPGSSSHGLNISAELPLTNTQEGHYSVCGENNADCRVKKGFIISQIMTPGGGVTLVTTHLDSGNDPEDNAARVTQLNELNRALEPYAGTPLILMGDLNLTASDANENAHLVAFLSAQGLSINARQTGKGHDIIASRGLELVNTMEYDAPDLTDHPLEMARFRYPSPAVQQSSTVTTITR